MHTSARLLAVAGSILFPAVLAAAGASNYLGSWELVIVNSGTSFRACALKLADDGGKLKGEMVWRWGSVFPLSGEQVSVSEKGELQIKNGEWASPLTLRRVGDALEGSVALKEGQTYVVFGAPGEENSSVVGSWDVNVSTDDGKKEGTLKISSNEKGVLEVEARGENGRQVTAKDFKRDGSKIQFSFDPKESQTGDSPLRFEGEIRGDRLQGKVIAPDGKQLPVDGNRRRRWGAPVKLLAQSGLDGWKPREASEKFRWTCEGGVLTNSEKGDVDIVSTSEFQDFQLHLEFKVVKGGNSGVYLRGRYEVQIQDDFGKPLETHGIGSIYSRVAPLVNAAKPAEEWQTFDITLVGRWLTVKLNDQTVIDNSHLDGITGGARDPYESRPGPLMLQGDHGKVWFRNVVVMPAIAD